MQVSRHGIIAIAAPIAAIAVMTFWLTGYGSQAIDEILPQRLPEVTIEQVTFEDSMILLNVRNTGLLEVEIAMADVNDRIQPAAVEPDGKLGRFESATIRIPFEWNEAEPYSVGVTTDDGTRFVREIESAAQVPERGIKLVGTLAILGVYVGIIPVMVGLLWSSYLYVEQVLSVMHFLLSLTDTANIPTQFFRKFRLVCMEYIVTRIVVDKLHYSSFCLRECYHVGVK